MKLRQGDHLPEIKSIPTFDPRGLHQELATPNGVVVVTQCCDLAFGQLVQVSPALRLSNEDADEARTGKSSKFGQLENPSLFVDLSKVATVPADFVKHNSTGLVRMDERTRRSFAAAFARRYSRFGFPDQFVPYLQPLQKQIRSKARRPNSPLYPILNRIATLRLEVWPDWDATNGLRVTLIVVVPPEYLPTDVAPMVGPARELTAISADLSDLLDHDAHNPRVSPLWDEFAEALADLMRKEMHANSLVSEIDSEVASLDTFSLMRYLGSAALDLDDISDS